MHKYILPFIIFLVLVSGTAMAQSQLRVEHFVRVKGQESTQIRAFGIVSGLNGTGDDPRRYTPTSQAILRSLARSGMFGSDVAGISGGRNSALVEVTVTIPGTGGRNGDTFDAIVVAVGNASSLAGGVLSSTALSTVFQQDENSLVLGMASGNVTIENAASPNVGRIVRGCRLLADFDMPFIQDGLITLVIRQEHARVVVANRIAEAINQHAEFTEFLPRGLARAVGSDRVIVRVPPTRFHEPMDFLEIILDAEMMPVPSPVPRIVINERAGIISIDVDVEIRPTLITHRNIVADIRPELAPGEVEELPEQFIIVDTDARFRRMNGEEVNNVKARALQASLNAIQATPQDIIDIIKILHAQGAIVGEVIFID